MKKLLTILAIFLLQIGFAQTKETQDSLKNSTYQYRFSVNDITTIGSSKLISDQLTDLFKTKPDFNETLSIFILTSDEEVDKYDLQKLIYSTGYTVSKFNKYQLTSK